MLLTSYRKNFIQLNDFSAHVAKTKNQYLECEAEMLNKLYRHHSADLLYTILKVVPHQETAEDLLHDTFMKVKSCIHLYEPEKSRLITWSKTIARNLAVDHLRLKSSRNSKLNQSLEFAEEELKIHYIYSFNIDQIGLRQIIRLLSAEQIAIIDLYYYKGFTYEEVARAMNMPLGTIKTRIRTSIHKLRRFFN